MGYAQTRQRVTPVRLIVAHRTAARRTRQPVKRRAARFPPLRLKPDRGLQSLTYDLRPYSQLATRTGNTRYRYSSPSTGETTQGLTLVFMFIREEEAKRQGESA